MNAVCRVCTASSFDPPFDLRENMFGTGGAFTYHQCSACRCLQIVERPENMAAYYPAHYYAHAKAKYAAIKAVRDGVRMLMALHGPAWLVFNHGRWARGDFGSLRDAGVRRLDRILDIGCGRGDLVRLMGAVGFRHLVGADPFVEYDGVDANGVRLSRCDASAIEGEFDLVMLHHSLEHVWDQGQIARDIFRLLTPGGRCIVRVPTIDSWAWEEYGRDWAQADAPRHVCLHSRGSIERLLEASGLRVTAIIDDSTGFQILGSEKIRRGHPLIDAASGKTNYEAWLPGALIAAAPRRAAALNAAGRGDSIAVHARRPD